MWYKYIPNKLDFQSYKFHSKLSNSIKVDNINKQIPK